MEEKAWLWEPYLHSWYVAGAEIACRLLPAQLKTLKCSATWHSILAIQCLQRAAKEDASSQHENQTMFPSNTHSQGGKKASLHWERTVLLSGRQATRPFPCSLQSSSCKGGSFPPYTSGLGGQALKSLELSGLGEEFYPKCISESI